MTSYNTQCEENMVFCYLKAYVHKSDLVLCSYCFTEKPTDYANMHLYLRLSPENAGETVCIDYGYEGIEKMPSDMETSNAVSYRSFKVDDEQGFYWCGEITVSGDYISQISGRLLQEKSILTINLVQTFSNGDSAVLFGNAADKGYDRATESGVFVVLDY